MAASEQESGTFVFADIAGYTALTEAHGDADAADLAATFCGETRYSWCSSCRSWTVAATMRSSACTNRRSVSRRSGVSCSEARARY